MSICPTLGNGDVGLTQFYSNGNTVTGKVELDLNSPEPNPSLYGIDKFERQLRPNVM